jgi:hypothetical protein
MDNLHLYEDDVQELLKEERNASRAALTEGMEPVARLYPDGKVTLTIPCPVDWFLKPLDLFTANQLAAAVLAARERCAKICENFAITDLGKAYGGQYASAIRGRNHE